MDPVTLALLAGGAAKAIGGIAQGIGTRRAAMASFSPEMQQRLEDLHRRQAEGELGLDEKQQAMLEQQYLSSQAAAARDLQASALQQAASAGPSVRGRDVFLRRQAEAEAQRQARQAQQAQVAAIDEAQRQAQREQIVQLEQAKAQAEAGKRAGTWQAVTGGLLGAGEAAMAGASMAQEKQLAEEGLGNLSDEELLLLLERRQATQTAIYDRYLGGR